MIAASDSVRPTIDEPSKLVGVTPATAARDRVRLLYALEQVFPVRFQAREPEDLTGLDGLLVIAPAQLHEWHVPVDDLGGQPGACPRLVAFPQAADSLGERTVIEFAGDAQILRPLREQKLTQEYGRPAPVPLAFLDSDSVLAAVAGKRLWWRRRDGSTWVHFSAFCPEELGEYEALRDHLRIGRFMGLIPLLHLLRHVCGELDWCEQPLKASFVIDDPNLHRTSYGFLDYSEMVAHARRHGYHVALATVPLDGWLANRRPVALVKENSASISLLMHGNDHVAGELGRLLDDRKAETALAQALRRVASFERRSGVVVERMMVPPHEVCSTYALKAMFRLGFDGACIGRRHPWHDQLPVSSQPPWTLLKWHPADVVEGLPILPRYPLHRSWEDLVLRALLRQPLILFAHHWDFSHGLDVLAQAADYINDLGEVHWGSVGRLARENFLTRRAGRAQIVQMHCVGATVEIPADVDVLEVRTPSSCGEGPERHLACGASQVAMARGASEWTSGALHVVPGARLKLRLISDAPLDPVHTPVRHGTPWPMLRRALVEGRDRARPLSRKLSGR